MTTNSQLSTTESKKKQTLSKRLEQEDQEIENLLENMMKENFPNLAKDLNMQV